MNHSRYGGFTWGEERKGSCWYKREGEKRHIPREAGNVGILKNQKMNPVWPKKASVYRLKNVQEIRTPKVDSNIREYHVNTNLRHRVLTSFIDTIKLATQRPESPRRGENSWLFKLKKKVWQAFAEWILKYHGTVS